MSPNLLDVDHVSKTFTGMGLFSRQSNHAVADVAFSLHADRPEVFTIIGESGSGKTTLAGMILNSMAPTRGTIRFKGRDLRDIRYPQGSPRFHAARSGSLPESVRRVQSPEARGSLPVQRRGTVRRTAVRPEDRAERADDALRKVGLSLAEVRGRYPHEMSGGQLQRVAIARAIISSPSLIVADEPVSMIDASLRMTVINLFKMLRDDLGVSIIYITHDLATAYYISDRLIIMQKGQGRRKRRRPRRYCRRHSIPIPSSCAKPSCRWTTHGVRIPWPRRARNRRRDLPFGHIM